MTNITEEEFHQLALHLIPGIGPKSAKQLISHCGSAKKIFKTKESTLLKIPGIGPKNAHLISNDPHHLDKAEDELAKIEKEKSFN